MPAGYIGDDVAAINTQNILDELIYKVRSQLPSGVSLKYCFECGEEIPERRRLILPGVKYCVKCQQELEFNGK